MSKALDVCYGRDSEGFILQVLAHHVVASKKLNWGRAGAVAAGWRRVGVFLVADHVPARFFVLEPHGQQLQSISFGLLYVCGHFRIVQKVTSAEQAADAMSRFEPK